MITSEKTEGLMTLFPLEVAKLAVKKFVSEDYAILKDTANSLTVKNDAEMAICGDFRKNVNTFIKLVEEKRKDIVEPLNAIVKDVNKEFKIASALFEGVMTDIDGKIKPYLIEQAKAKEQLAEMRRKEELSKMEETKKMLADAEFETGNKALLDMANNVEAEQKVLAEKEIVVKKSAKGFDSTTSMVKRWKYKVISDRSVPLDFLMVDDSAVKEAMKSNKEGLEKGTFKISGIEFYSEFDLSSR